MHHPNGAILHRKVHYRNGSRLPILFDAANNLRTLRNVQLIAGKQARAENQNCGGRFNTIDLGSTCPLLITTGLTSSTFY